MPFRWTSESENVVIVDTTVKPENAPEPVAYGARGATVVVKVIDQAHGPVAPDLRNRPEHHYRVMRAAVPRREP
jgi:hypothetical protein